MGTIDKLGSFVVGPVTFDGLALDFCRLVSGKFVTEAAEQKCTYSLPFLKSGPFPASFYLFLSFQYS